MPDQAILTWLISKTNRIGFVPLDGALPFCAGASFSRLRLAFWYYLHAKGVRPSVTVCNEAVRSESLCPVIGATVSLVGRYSHDYYGLAAPIMTLVSCPPIPEGIIIGSFVA